LHSGRSPPFDISLNKQWTRASLQELLYALYKKGKLYNREGSASYILDNIGKLSSDEFYDPRNNMHFSIEESLIAISELATKQNFDGIYQPNPLQKLLLSIRWFHSDHIGEFADNHKLASLFGLSKYTLSNYIYGIRSIPKDFDNFGRVVSLIKGYPTMGGYRDRYLDLLYDSAKEFVETASGDLMNLVTWTAHYGYEDITNKRIDSIGTKVIHETKIPAGTQPDNLIIRIGDGENENNAAFIREIENKQNIISKNELIGHKEVAVDYTISPDLIWLRQKCEDRNYATDNRFLIIVLYGYHNEATIKKAREFVDKYDNVKLLTHSEYKSFLGLDRSGNIELTTSFDVLTQATIDIFSKYKSVSDQAVEILRNIRSTALLSLKEHKALYRDYFDRYLGKQP